MFEDIIIRKSLRNTDRWVVDVEHTPDFIHPDGSSKIKYIDYKTGEEAKKALDLFISKQQSKPNPKIRQFDTGATRDIDKNKPSYVKALSPIVLQGYVEYLGRHRLQSDGNLRDWDNWKKGIPQEVYLDGLGRHEMAVWLLCHGFPASDNHGPVTLLDSLYGVIFNSIGMAHEILKKKPEGK